MFKKIVVAALTIVGIGAIARLVVARNSETELA